MHENIERVLFAEEEIRDKVRELGERISRDYAGRDLMLLCVLKGAFVFALSLIHI